MAILTLCNPSPGSSRGESGAGAIIMSLDQCFTITQLYYATTPTIDKLQLAHVQNSKFEHHYGPGIADFLLTQSL